MEAREIALVALSAALVASCCLDIVSNAPPQDGGSSGLGASSGSIGSGAATGSASRVDSGLPQVGCGGVYCSPFYVCDSEDGLCKCGGQLCTGGHCSADSETCLPGCPTDGGPGDLTLTLGPDPDYPLPPPGSSNAIPLPVATIGRAYTVQFDAFCGKSPWFFISLGPLPSGLTLYPNQGIVEGVPTTPTKGAPFEVELTVQDSVGAVAFQNFLVQIGTGN